MKRTLTSFLIFILILILASTINSQPDEKYTGEFQTNSGKNIEVSLSLAETDVERKKGLMWTFALSEKRGMLFIFEEEQRRGFWMKNTFIPLDIVYLDSDMRVINIEQASPEPFTKDDKLETYNSKGPAKYVLEFNEGFTKRKNISEGDLFLPSDKLSACCIMDR